MNALTNTTKLTTCFFSDQFSNFDSLRVPFAIFVIIIAFFIHPMPVLAGTPPTISIMSPSTSVALNVGQSQQFNAEATAGSGIKGIEWFIGSSSEQYTDYTDSWIYYQQDSFSNTFSTSGTYYVYAYVYDRETPQREAFVFWTVNVTIPAPQAPTGVSATDGTYTDKVRVSWNSSSGATSYEVWRHMSNNSGSATKIASPTGTSYDDTSTEAGTTYYYWIKAKNTGGTSGFSTPNSGYRQVSPPPAPTGVSATDGTYTDKVRVSWNSSSGATSYEVWRHMSNNSGSATKIASPTGTSYDDTSAEAGTTYYYWVKAKNAGGTSGFSTSDSGYRQASLPTISIMSPSTPVALNVGQSQQFNAEATAGSGIKGIEWFIGSSSEQYTDYTDSWIYYQQDSFTHTFGTAGTYYVHAYVYDRDTPQREAFVTWTVNVYDGPRFIENFNTAEIDNANWHVADNETIVSGNWATKENIVVSGGIAKFRSYNDDDDVHPRRGSEIHTLQNHHYGAYRVRMKGPSGTGADNSGSTVAFFTYINGPDSNATGNNRQEIDIELFGETPGQVDFTIWYNDQSGKRLTTSVEVDSTNYHEYGFDWQLDSIAFYIDGVEQSSLWYYWSGDSKIELPGGVRSSVTKSDFMTAYGVEYLPNLPAPIFLNSWVHEWNGMPPLYTGSRSGMYDYVIIPVEDKTGDVNNDGVVDLKDAIVALRVLANLQSQESINLLADVNGDGKIGMEEVLYIYQKTSGLRQ